MRIFRYLEGPRIRPEHCVVVALRKTRESLPRAILHLPAVRGGEGLPLVEGHRRSVSQVAAGPFTQHGARPRAVPSRQDARPPLLQEALRL